MHACKKNKGIVGQNEHFCADQLAHRSINTAKNHHLPERKETDMYCNAMEHCKCHLTMLTLKEMDHLVDLT